MIAGCLLVPALGCMQMNIGEKFLFNPIKGDKHPATEASMEPVLLTAPDRVHISGLFLIHPRARGSVLYFGPNMDTAEGMLPFLRAYRNRARVNVLMVNYRGYGFSEGEPSWETLASDGKMALEWLKARPEAAGKPLVLHGFSLGSLIVSMIAASTPVDGAILQGSGTTVREYARHRIPWFAKPFARITIAPKLDRLDNREWVRQNHAPLLVLVGKKDEAAYWKMSRELYEASPSANKRFVCLPKGHHNGLETQPGYDDAVMGFLDSVIQKKPQPTS